MCHPAVFIATALIQAQQQQQAEDAQIRAMNNAAEDNAKMQNEAHAHDMGTIYTEEINIAKEGFKSAEDAANAKLDMLISGREDVEKLKSQNETGVGGNTSDAIIGNLKRHILNQARDIDDNFQRGVTSRQQELTALQSDKISKRLSTVSAIKNMPTSNTASTAQRAMRYSGAAVQGYVGYKSYTKVNEAKV